MKERAAIERVGSRTVNKNWEVWHKKLRKMETEPSHDIYKHIFNNCSCGIWNDVRGGPSPLQKLSGMVV
jgi:hypothetical protein